jgi:hypothetical protein
MTYPAEPLTSEEQHCMRMLSEVADLMSRIIGHDTTRAGDWNEAATHIHNLQHMVMAQAAARAYPDTYRLLGERIR